MLEGFKKKLQEKIERNAVKIPNISWTKKNGKVVTEDILLKRSRIPLIGDWARIYPPVTILDEIDEKTGDNKLRINWMNLIFGGVKNLIKLALIMIILYSIYTWVTGILGVYAEYFNGNDYIIIAKEIFNKFCETSIYTSANHSQVGSLNVTIFK